MHGEVERDAADELLVEGEVVVNGGFTDADDFHKVYGNCSPAPNTTNSLPPEQLLQIILVCQPSDSVGRCRVGCF